jgi:hypothetical protein
VGAAASILSPQSALERREQGVEFILSQPRGDLRGERVHRALRILAHPRAEVGQRHDHVTAVGGVDFEWTMPSPTIWLIVLWIGLPRHAEVACDIRRAHDAADDVVITIDCGRLTSGQP